MGDLKLLDFLKLNISVILQLVGFYLSFLTINASNAVNINATDFLTLKAIEYLGWPFLLYIVIYLIGQSFAQIAMINFADWVVKKRLKDYTHEEIIEKLDSYGRFLVKVTKLNEQAIGHQISKVVIAAYNYAVFVTLLVLHLSLLLKKPGFWWVFIATLTITTLLHFSIFFLKHVNTLKLAKEAKSQN